MLCAPPALGCCRFRLTPRRASPNPRLRRPMGPGAPSSAKRLAGIAIALLLLAAAVPRADGAVLTACGVPPVARRRLTGEAAVEAVDDEDEFDEQRRPFARELIPIGGGGPTGAPMPAPRSSPPPSPRPPPPPNPPPPRPPPPNPCPPPPRPPPPPSPSPPPPPSPRPPPPPPSPSPPPPPSPSPPPPPPSPSPPPPPAPIASPTAACWNVQHRFTAQPADFQGLYPDSAPLAVDPWYGVPVRSDQATAPLSFNDVRARLRVPTRILAEISR